jgi:cytochrome c biogenesis protein CcdA
MDSIFLQSFSSFSAGLLSSLSPCVYPMIPISLGFLGLNSEGSKTMRVWLFFIGQVIGFTGLGLVAVQLGEIFGFTSESPLLNGAIGIALITFGISSWHGHLPAFFQRWNSIRPPKWLTSQGSWFGPIFIGIGSAIMASPCTSPILGSVLVMLSQTGSFTAGVILMTLYAIGASLVFLLLGLGLFQMKKLPRSGAWMRRVHRISSIGILVAGVYYIYRATLA